MAERDAALLLPPVVELQAVCKHHVMGEGLVRALDSVDLRIHQGECVAVTGPSGAGKSSLLQIVGCLDRPSSGSFSLAGQEVAGLDDDALSRVRNECIGFVFQSFHLLPRATALENVMLPLQWRRMSRAARRERAAAALERVGMTARMDHHPHQLSGGQRQRVAIARALCTEPSLLLADEPTGSLDSETADEIMELFMRLHGQGQTVVVVTHEARLAARCERQIRLVDGRISSDEEGLNAAA